MAIFKNDTHYIQGLYQLNACIHISLPECDKIKWHSLEYGLFPLPNFQESRGPHDDENGKGQRGVVVEHVSYF